jgi:hypothetical protein
MLRKRTLRPATTFPIVILSGAKDLGEERS